MDNINSQYKYLQHNAPRQAAGLRVVVIGEVLWDLFPDSARLGGAPLNVAVHLKRLHHEPLLVSAVGTDDAGERAKRAIAALGLDTSLLRSTDRHPTGNATVRIDINGDPSFAIERPAAYDDLVLADSTMRELVRWNPEWIYYGTLFPSSAPSWESLQRLWRALPDASRFYDLNLRPGFESPSLVDALLQNADVVKLNERELQFLHDHLALPADPEQFCRAAAARYQWRGVCVTFGARGCGLWLAGEYLAAPGIRIEVADPVGAGDAFAAALLHGVVSEWPIDLIVRFANHAGAQVAATYGAIPDSSTGEPIRHTRDHGASSPALAPGARPGQ